MNFSPIGGKFRSLAVAVGCRKSRFKAKNRVSVLFGGQFFEFQPGVRIIQRDAYHVVNEAGDLITLRRLQLPRQAENLKQSRWYLLQPGHSSERFAASNY